MEPTGSKCASEGVCTARPAPARRSGGPWCCDASLIATPLPCAFSEMLDIVTLDAMPLRCEALADVAVGAVVVEVGSVPSYGSTMMC